VQLTVTTHETIKRPTSLLFNYIRYQLPCQHYYLIKSLPLLMVDGKMLPLVYPKTKDVMLSDLIGLYLNSSKLAFQKTNFDTVFLLEFEILCV